jgi:hypothetical protein
MSRSLIRPTVYDRDLASGSGDGACESACKTFIRWAFFSSSSAPALQSSPAAFHDARRNDRKRTGEFAPEQDIVLRVVGKDQPQLRLIGRVHHDGIQQLVLHGGMPTPVLSSRSNHADRRVLRLVTTAIRTIGVMPVPPAMSETRRARMVCPSTLKRPRPAYRICPVGPLIFTVLPTLSDSKYCAHRCRRGSGP